MSWFVFALLTLLLWGGADLFYKMGADEKDPFSHLKTVIAVGLVMGLHALYTLFFSGIEYNPLNLLRYLPVSLCYILSMAVGYFGLRYLELSISSPIQNTSGALVALLCMIFLGDTFPLPVLLAIGLICAAVFFLGLLEKREMDKLPVCKEEQKYRIGFGAFFLPIGYCIIDALGTFLDAFYLDDLDSTPLLGITEDTLETVANTSYELTFLLAAVVCAVYVYGIRGERLRRKQLRPARLGAAVLETAGQFTYVYAMSGGGGVAAAMIAAYSIVSLLLSRLFLKEKLTLLQYFAIGAVMAGIVILGVFDV